MVFDLIFEKHMNKTKLNTFRKLEDMEVSFARLNRPLVLRPHLNQLKNIKILFI